MKKQRHKKSILNEVRPGVFVIPPEMLLDFGARVEFKKDRALQKLIINKVAEFKVLADFFGVKTKAINAKEEYLRICKLYGKRPRWQNYPVTNDSRWKSQFLA